MAEEDVGDVEGNRAQSIQYYVENVVKKNNTCDRFPRSWSPIMKTLGYL
jgi:hypothetical protein